MSSNVDKDLERPVEAEEACPGCDGEGYVGSTICPHCQGARVAPREEPEGAPGAESIAPDVVRGYQEQDPPDTGEGF